MDIEFQDTSISEKAVFYKDSGHSFDALLFYGHEFSLIIFDIMLFSFVDLFAQDFLLAGIVTFFVGKVNHKHERSETLSYTSLNISDSDDGPSIRREIQLGQKDFDWQAVSYLESVRKYQRIWWRLVNDAMIWTNKLILYLYPNIVTFALYKLYTVFNVNFVTSIK